MKDEFDWAELVDENGRLRAELIVARSSMRGWTACAQGLKAELVEAEDAIARVRALCVRYTSRAFPECMHVEEFLRALDGEL